MSNYIPIQGKWKIQREKKDKDKDKEERKKNRLHIFTRKFNSKDLL